MSKTKIPSRVDITRFKNRSKSIIKCLNAKKTPSTEDIQFVAKYLDYAASLMEEKSKEKATSGNALARADEEILRIITDYANFRGLKRPNEAESLLFVGSEFGELCDAVVQEVGGWVRNDPNRERDVQFEVGDVFIMLCEFARNRKIGVISSMLKKIESKGFKP